MNRLFNHSVTLFIILAVATLLRCWNIWELEFGYDELSAIFRAQNNPSWAAHLYGGIVPDGHPGGVQTILWIWNKFLPIGPTGLKLLMAICGIASVYFIYKAGESARNKQTGYIASSLMAVLYMPVFWSQQVRPYAPGMLLCSMLLWLFCRIVFENQRSIPLLLSYGLLLALCAYTHYFAALFALYLWIAGIIVCRKLARPGLFLAGAEAFILFLPHIYITLKQLSNKGLNWLEKPKFDFFPGHLYELFSRSYLLVILVCVIVITGVISMYKFKKTNSSDLKRIIIFLALFAAPLITGFVYSIFMAPVLQHSVLIFSMPLLLLIIGIFASFAPPSYYKIHIFIILISGSLVLIGARKHYNLGYKNAYVEQIKTCNSLAQFYSKDSLVCLIDGEPDILDYYLKKYNSQNIPFRRFSGNIDSTIVEDLINVHFLNKKPWLVLCSRSGTSEYLLAFLEDAFGKAVQRNSWIQGELFLYGNKSVPEWKYNALSTSKSNDISFASMEPSANDYIVIKAENDCYLNPECEIQSAIYCQSKKTIDWRSTKVKNAKQAFGNARWDGRILHVIKLADIPGWNYKCNLMVKCEPLDKGSSFVSCYFSNFGYRIMKGNPYMYGVE